MAVSKRRDIRSQTEYMYTISLRYVQVKKNKYVDIKNECLKSMIIDHNYEINNMPILYANLKLDKSLVDDMIKNQNDNTMVITLNKYDNSSDIKSEINVFNMKFIYFLPDNVNRMDPVDYNNETNETMKGDTYTELTLGLIALEHVNNNKKACEMTAKDISMYSIVKYITSHMNNLIIEPFSYNDKFDQFILKPQNSVSKALNYLNQQKVFYSTPYRYYEDFGCTYIISSSGKAISRKNELYSSIVLSVQDITSKYANNTGVITNRTTGTYEVYVNYANTQVYDNTIANKSKNKIRGITSSGASDLTLSNSASYSKNKMNYVRLDNDNEHMIDNIEADNNTKNFLVYFSKNDLDTDLFSINKRISIHNIDRYQEFNGNYLLYRKREMYLREDQNFKLTTMINMRRIDTNVD